MLFAKKTLGQHFLMHRRIAERIVHAANISSNDVVLEIGPGTGLLTRALLAQAKKVIAVETDHELIPQLQETFTTEIGTGKLAIIEQDIHSFDMKKIGEPYHVVANIPYYITGEILRNFLETSHPPLSMTLLVQKEVAVRIARSKKESLLSLSVKVYGVPSYCFTVPKGAFVPAPSVDSAVMNIANITSPFTSDNQEKRFFEILHAGFGQKRKQLLKNLDALVSKSVAEQVLLTARLPLTARAEDVPLEVWLELSKP